MLNIDLTWIEMIFDKLYEHVSLFFLKDFSGKERILVNIYLSVLRAN